MTTFLISEHAVEVTFMKKCQRSTPTAYYHINKLRLQDYLSICVCVSVCLSVYLSIYLFIYGSTALCWTATAISAS
jgi:hypothetical protein